MVEPKAVEVPSLEPRTTMRSALRTVDRRCAMMIVVIFEPPEPPPTRLSIAVWTIFSDSLSSAEVASSRMRTEGLRIRARAMATLCFSPPLSLPPRAPTLVS
mmetsp:Transcript_9667/g.18410  ORF Transcript_9667/g.18410 Transcript_9667/m.18410 type:complete len:102 (-) Transcript_9667:1824-2129(-)